jgi:hypothetical protein
MVLSCSKCVSPPCVCTGYAIMRRRLRQHRVQMKIMSAMLDQADLQEEFQNRVIDRTGNTGFWLGHIPEYDDDSDDQDDDPEAVAKDTLAKLVSEKKDLQCFIEAVSGVVKKGPP